MPHTAEQLIGAYVKLRDNKKELADMQKEQMKPFNHKMGIIEAALLDVLNTSGGESIRSKSGTVYRIVRTSVKIDDWEEALQFVLDNNLLHLLEKRLAKSGVEEYIEANGAAPPGVAITTDAAIGIRRS